MSGVAVLIPWRGGCEHRARALAWVVARHAENPWPVVIGRHDHGEWCKARATAEALAQTDAAVLVLVDADVWTDGLALAVSKVAEGAAWAIPHRGVFRLAEDATTRLLDGDKPDVARLAERAYLGTEAGGIVVMRRDVYEACPLDARFVGWGSEDEAHGMALRTLYGPPWRGKASLTHLWHQPQDRATRSFGSESGRDLRKRYARCQGNPDAMRALLREAPCLLPTC